MREWRKRTSRATTLAALALLAACGGSRSTTGSSETTPEGSAPTAAPIFDASRLHEVLFDLDPAAWQALRDNYLDNQYYAANLTIDGASVLQVGIRSRGSGSRNQQKPGLRLDFNRYVPTQEFYGYKSLVLRNQVQDASMLRDRLSFLVFEAMDIPAPRNAFARLTVNGEYWGLYNLVEQVSKPFLEMRLGEKSGTLYDYQWIFPYDFSSLGPDAGRYVPLPFQPETNEEKPDVAAGLVAFVQALNDTPDASFVSEMEARLDVTRFLTHVAVEDAIAEGDGIVGDQGLNNFYLYEYGARNRFVFIPWDKDNTFRSGSWPLYRNLETNVLTRRLTADPARRQVYADAVARAVDAYVNPRWLTPQLEVAYQQIRSAALSDARKPFTNAQFEAAVDGVRGVIAAREGDVHAQR
jgi:spore coat protein CotH